MSLQLCEGLAKKGRRGRTIGIKVRLADWTNATRARSIEAPTNDVEVVTGDRARAAARLRAAEAGAAARGADRVVRGRRRAAAAAGAARRGPARARAALVERGGELAARLARDGVLDPELVEHADDGAAQVVAAVRVLRRRDRADQRRPARARPRRRRARRTRPPSSGVALEPQARGEPVGGEGAGDVGRAARAPPRARRGRRAGARAGRRRRRGRARARARGAGRPRRRS